jgi:hypothetical protein
MKTNLIEFYNTKNQILRGILLNPKDSDKGVIFISGFERNGTTEPKFKDLADKLYQKNIASMRFDFSGCGLSDGDFRYTSLKNWTKEFEKAYNFFKSKLNLKSISIVAHSLGCCVAGKYIEKNPKNISKLVLLAPALNQKELMRYWFVTGIMKKENKNLKINWENYNEYLNEKEFNEDVKREDKMSKYNFIDPEYFLGASRVDVSNSFKNIKSKVLHIHGESDDAVPIQSLNINFPSKIIVKKGNHDIERPDQRKQWIKKAVEYLTK